MTARTAFGVGAYAELIGTPHAAHRALVRDVLGEDHPSVHEAALIISELVSNAIRRSRSSQPGGTVAIAVETAPRSGDVRIRVRDAGGTGAPVLINSDRDREHGRGLAVIDSLAAEWGSEATHVGRVTRCRLSADLPANDPALRVPEREAG